MLWPKKIHTRNLLTKKIPAARKFPSPHNLSDGRSLKLPNKSKAPEKRYLFGDGWGREALVKSRLKHSEKVKYFQHSTFLFLWGFLCSAGNPVFLSVSVTRDRWPVALRIAAKLKTKCIISATWLYPSTKLTRDEFLSWLKRYTHQIRAPGSVQSALKFETNCCALRFKTVHLTPVLLCYLLRFRRTDVSAWQ